MDTNTDNKSTPSVIAQSIHTEVHHLPLWQTTLAAMRREGISFGSFFSNEYFEMCLGASAASAEFGLGIAHIRLELEFSGFHLTARGQGGNGFVVSPPEALADVMLRYERKGISYLCRAVTLGSNADLRTLSPDQRRRHEAVLTRVAQRAALVSRKLPRELQGMD